MRVTTWPAVSALILSLVIGSAPASLPVLAQTVPLPPPAPLPKEGALPPLSAPQAIAPMPPAAVPGAQPPAAPAPSSIAGILSPTARTATAFDAGQRAVIDRVNGYLNSVNSLVGGFVQVGPDGSRTEGQFYLLKPGKVRFEYNPPSPVELVADGSAVAVRDRKLATQDIYPLSQTPLRFLLADRLDLLRDTTVIGVYQDELFLTVVIEEKSAVAGTHRLMIMFGAKDNLLKQWTITDPQGYDTTIAVFNLDATRKPDPKLFRINYERVLQ